MGRKRRRRFEMDSIDEINMTPLIDLTFLLLIVFMITMPLVEYSTQVSTPAMNSAPMPDAKDSQIIVVDKNGHYFIGKNRISEAELIETVNNLKISNPDLKLLIKGDEAVEFGKVIELMKIIKNGGFEDVSLITQEE
ncbi:MAG: biopolymer transporter ExbD [Lentisphaeria bacterium]|nr:biopolymer transporter ExbD [Lentisphaeria bacterium]